MRKHDLTNNTNTFRAFKEWPLRHLIRVVRKQDLTNKKTMTKTITMTNTFGEQLQKAIFETFDLWDIWSEWKKHDLTNKKTMKKTMTMTNTFREDILNTLKWQSKRSSESGHILLLWILTFPDQTGGGWPNFTISAKFHNTGISGVRAVSKFLQCLSFLCTHSLWMLWPPRFWHYNLLLLIELLDSKLQWAKTNSLSGWISK